MNMQEFQIFSVSEFVEYINLAIGTRRVAVEGEVSGYQLNQGKWIFFDLKDDSSKIGCFAAAWNVRGAFEDGMRVRVHGAPRVYGKSGRFSIMVERVELVGEGALRRAFELTKAKLEKEGLFDVARKRICPSFPERIGLIASKESAAYTDFMRMIRQRWSIEVFLMHVQVQGEAAIDDIVTAFTWFNEHASTYRLECIVLIRGGGSLEDLAAFNSESVARAVFGSRIPVVCGVGHERDESLADNVADVRAATPTHAALLATPDREEIARRISSASSRISSFMDHTLDWYAHQTQTRLLLLQRAVASRLENVRTFLSRFNVCISRFEGALDTARETLATRAHVLFIAASHACITARQDVRGLERTLRTVDPSSVLKRGYSIVRKKGRVVKTRADVAPGDAIAITMTDGAIEAEVLGAQGRLSLNL